MVCYPNIACGDFTLVWFFTSVSSSMSFRIRLDLLKLQWINKCNDNISTNYNGLLS